MQRSRQLSCKKLTSVVRTQFVRSSTGLHRLRQKSVNQDSVAICNKFQSLDDKHLYVVCDGHGDYGHLVSNFITTQFPINFQNALQSRRSELERVPTALHETIKRLDTDLETTGIDTCLSGSTAVVVYVTGDKLFVAHVGDSRAVMGSKYGSHWVTNQITADHKPEHFDETQRIMRKGGEVRRTTDSSRNPTGPYRVWLAGQDSPGLAMSRSIGDGHAKQAGVIADADVKVVSVTADDRFLLIATDGLWEYIDSEEAVTIVARKADRGSFEEACDALVEEAHLRWRRVGQSVDDISVVLVVLET
jgi:serine/threonine protein phosphatase PrpC